VNAQQVLELPIVVLVASTSAPLDAHALSRP
jgi:hypothetical protein